ncbi:MBL fold metallo-hydrolase [Dokdonia sp.]|uniref:MBL fold metallo-hydrolase n=1 Tax=Dokdonia sp. TaxID=2024995 RepID=UPI003263D329
MTTEKKYYLRANVLLEPLIDRWYANTHLISPATAVRNIKNRHLKIMTSFIDSPRVHEIALQSPEMLGGPFMNISASEVQTVRNVVEETKANLKNLLDFSDALDELHYLLKDEATGYNLDEIYEEVPEILKGFIEIVYDLNNNASFKLKEALLYKSDYYREDMQSVVLQLVEDDERDFIFGTPRINYQDKLFLNIAFKNHFIDEISKMRWEPKTVNEILSIIDLDAEDEVKLMKLLTDKLPKQIEPFNNEGVRIRYFGHACVLVETKNTAVIVDPFIGYDGFDIDLDRFTLNDLPNKIDAVIITHNHQDHVVLETLLPIRHKIKKLIVPRCNPGALQDPSLRLALTNIGFENVVEMDEMDSQIIGDIVITGIPFMGEHSDLDINAKLCYHLKINNLSVLFAADSCNIEPNLYKKVQKLIGDVDILFLGMECDGAPLTWIYGPLLFEEMTPDEDRSRKLNGSNCLQGNSLVEIFNPKEVYVYAFGAEPWLKFMMGLEYQEDSLPILESNDLVRFCKEKGITSERLYGKKELLRETD